MTTQFPLVHSPPEICSIRGVCVWYPPFGYIRHAVGCRWCAHPLLDHTIARRFPVRGSPPIAMKRPRWMGTHSKENAGNFGNLRSVPLVVDREIIFAAAYSSELCAISLDDGRMLPATKHSSEPDSTSLAAQTGDSWYSALSQPSPWLQRPTPSSARSWCRQVTPRMLH